MKGGKNIKENMTTFIPRRINAKASKTGRTYWEIETDQGNATCFDYPVVQEIEKHLGKPISLYDLEANEKGFINIRATKGAGRIQPAQIVQPVQAQPANGDNFAEARKAKDTSVYTSYAKDIFLALLQADKSESLDASKLMQAAIERVQQARKAFE